MPTPNPSRGEGSVVFGDKTFLLKFNMSAIRKFEQRTGRGLAGAFSNVLDIKFDDVFTAILIGVETKNETTPGLKQKLSVKRLDRLADAYGEYVQEAIKATVEAIAEALPKSKVDEDDEDEDELEGTEAKGDAVPLSPPTPDSSTGVAGSPLPTG